MTYRNLVTNAITQKPYEFEQDFKEIISDKIADIIDNSKIDIAKSLFKDRDSYEEPEIYDDEYEEDGE